MPGRRWRHNGRLTRGIFITMFCDGNAYHFIGPLWAEILHKGPVMCIFDISVVLRPSKRLNEQPHCQWFETPWCSCDAIAMSVTLSLVVKQSWLLIVWSQPLVGPLITVMTSSNGNIFRVTGHLCWEFTGHRWIPRTKASAAELWCFLWPAPEWTIE